MTRCGSLPSRKVLSGRRVITRQVSEDSHEANQDNKNHHISVAHLGPCHPQADPCEIPPPAEVALQATHNS